MKIVGHIYEETNYNLFRRLSDNRDLYSNRVGKLIASMTERYICNPIIVNEKMEVIDGQGRFEARKSMGKPIHFIIVDGANSDDCMRMNKYNTQWTALDFAKSYAKRGCLAYTLLLETCKETKLSIATVLRLSNHGAREVKGSNKMSVFELGKLDFNENDKHTVKYVTDLANELLDALQFSARVNDAFRVGVKIISETQGYDHNRMVKNCKAQRSSYVQMSRLNDQLVEFERIYNNRLRTTQKLYFSDYMRNRGSNVRSYEKSYSPYNEEDTSSLKEVTE